MITKFSVLKMFFAAIAAACFVACKNTGEASFPSGDAVFPQPVSQPLQYDTPSKIDWPGKLAAFTPTQKKIDFNKFPQTRFDTSGFRPFLKPPSLSSFNFNTLRDTVFNYESLPSLPLHFKTSVLEAPKIIRARKPYLKQPKNGQIYSLGEPLTGAVAECIFQSKDGMIWIANERGLYRYDGEYYALYAIPEKKSQVFNIKEDKQGQLWISTQQDGIFVLDLKAGISRHLTSAEGLLSDTCPRIFFDESNRAWIACVPFKFNPNLESSTETGGGISIIDPVSKTIKQFTSRQGLARNAGSGIMQDDKGNIWIGTLFGSLNIINTKEKKLKWLGVPDGLSTNLLTDINQDVRGRIWVSGWRGDINVIDPAGSTITHIGVEQGIPRAFMSTISSDKKGNTWIGCFNYVAIFNNDLTGFKILTAKNGLDGPNNNAVFSDRNNNMWISTTDGPNTVACGESAPQYIHTNDISTLSEDNMGRIWIGFLAGNGIQILDTTTGLVKSFTTKEGLSDDAVQWFLHDGDKVWITSLEKGIDIVNTNANTILHAEKESGLRSNQVIFCAKDKSGYIWTGMNKAAGFDRINLKNNTVYYLGREQGFKDSVIIDLKENNDGTFWFSSFFNGVGLIDTVAKTLKHIVNIPAFESEQNNYILLLPDSKGNSWIASKKGLVMINNRKDSFQLFTTREGLSDNNINTIGEYNGKIYVGTINGLDIISRNATGDWQINNAADKSDGLVKTAGAYASDLITKRGDYWWGDQGITILPNLNNFSNDSSSSTVAITGFDILGKPQLFSDEPWTVLNTETDTLRSAAEDTFYVNGNFSVNELNKDVKWDSVTLPYNLPQNLRLPYYKNYLQFHYTRMQPGSNDTTIYRYILEGIDKQWSEKTKNTFTENYLNLTPGDYTFKVSAFNHSIWSQPVSFSFTIMPPWWKTWWAYLLYALIAAAIVWSFIQYRSRWLQKENRRLEEMVKLRTNELSQSLDELKATQTQLIQSEKMASLGELTAGIAHEIQNPLNFVNNFSEVNKELLGEMKDEMDKGNIDEAKNIAGNIIDNEEKINHHGKRADNIVKGMLQHSRSGSGQKELTDINALADEYLRLSYHGLRAKDKSFNADLRTDFDKTLPSINIIPQDIGRAILNLFTNAFYSVNQKKALNPDGYNPVVSVTTRKIGNKAEIIVKDNGMGIPQKSLEKIFQPFYTTKPTGQGTGLGLSLSYDIVKAHGGELSVGSGGKAETKEGEGAEFVILLPL